MRKSTKEDHIWIVKYCIGIIICSLSILCGLEILKISNNMLISILGILATLGGIFGIIVSVLAILNLKGIDTGKY